MASQAAEILVHLPAAGSLPTPAQLLVQIEDTSELDRPAQVLAHLVLDVSHLDRASPHVLRLMLPCPELHGELTVSAVVAGDVSQPPGIGDLLTPAVVRLKANGPTDVHLVEYRDGGPVR
jgi:hypothetical protein